MTPVFSRLRSPRLKPCLGLLLLILLFSSCALFHHEKSPYTENRLMRQAVDDYNSRDYKKAIESFQAVKDQYPFSPYVPLAELKIADANFNLEKWNEAIYAYEDFVKLHPNNEAVPYAVYQTGMCYFKQMRTIDRDQDIARKAVTEFQRVIRIYPDSTFRVKAENRVATCMQNLALHELYVGRFYFRRGNYKAAKLRFEGVVKNFPDLGQYNEALEFIRRCDQKIQQKELKQPKQKGEA